MFKLSLICLMLNVIITPIVLSQNLELANDITNVVDLEIQEAFEFSQVIESTIKEYINQALPAEAKPEGEQILENVKEGLASCESNVKTTLDIWRYKVCSSAILRDGMAALKALQVKYRPMSSGATRLGLFF